MFLDQSIFQEEGFYFSICDNKIKVSGSLYKTLCLRVVISFLEIAAHPFFKILCFTYVQYSPIFILEKIATRQMRKGLQINHL